MACYHPLSAYYRVRDDGKKDVVFVDSNDLPSYEKDGKIYFGKLSIPCGQCLGCRLEYSRQWAIRCMLEASAHKHNLFVTLTYDDLHLPFRIYDCKIDEFTGEVFEDISHPLVKTHPSMFIKRLRSYCKYHFDHDGIKVYYCGEYGDENGRPHYHLLLFNVPDFGDFEYKFSNAAGQRFYNSQIFDSLWSDDFGERLGFVVIGDVTFDSCAYVSRYIMKKQKGQAASFYKERGLEPEFCCMSRRPGIAREYYDENKDRIYDLDEIPVIGPKGKPMNVKPLKYYDSLFSFEDPDTLALLKSKRQSSAENSMKHQLKKTSLSQSEYLQLKENNRVKAFSLLHREL